MFLFGDSTTNRGGRDPSNNNNCIVGNKGTKVHFYVQGFSLWGTKCPLILKLCDIFSLQMDELD
jgi:hypothetical protein